jgi:hypothetical protein
MGSYFIVLKLYTLEKIFRPQEARSYDEIVSTRENHAWQLGKYQTKNSSLEISN